MQMTNYNSQPTPNRKCVKHPQVAAHPDWSIYQLVYAFGNSWFSAALTLDILSILLHTSACLIAIVDVYRVFVMCWALFKALHSFNLDSNPQRTFDYSGHFIGERAKPQRFSCPRHQSK